MTCGALFDRNPWPVKRRGIKWPPARENTVALFKQPLPCLAPPASVRHSSLLSVRDGSDWLRPYVARRGATSIGVSDPAPGDPAGPGTVSDDEIFSHHLSTGLSFQRSDRMPDGSLLDPFTGHSGQFVQMTNPRRGKPQTALLT